MKLESSHNNEIILREKLALQRTILANQSTFLSFLRTAMYFFIAGLSVNSLLKVDCSFAIEMSFFISSFLIFCIGVFNYFRHKKIIDNSEKHIGNYIMEHLK